ncbi:MAG TPA: hypothetical protein VK447_08160, partial [Myxococcaceae bacterium]|nr:hypothetical protein [Myxococcaceae bacterium]
RPGWPDALALRASVLLEEAEAEPRPERQRELRRQALSALSGAVARNANLGPAWRDQLDRTRLASPSPP